MSRMQEDGWGLKAFRAYEAGSRFPWDEKEVSSLLKECLLDKLKHTYQGDSQRLQKRVSSLQEENRCQWIVNAHQGGSSRFEEKERVSSLQKGN